MIWNYISREFLCAATGWFLAQLIKCIISLIETKTVSWQIAFGSGGMPSSHTSTVVALATAVGISSGTNTTMFGVTAIIAIIVMYDAMNVRRETGDQGKLINELIEIMKLTGTEFSSEKKFKELVGHTPIQVLMGAILGFVVGFVMMTFLL